MSVIVQDDVKFLTTLFAQLNSEETDDNQRRDLVFFLKEFCTFSQTLQQPNRESFFKVMRIVSGVRLCTFLLFCLNHISRQC